MSYSPANYENSFTDINLLNGKLISENLATLRMKSVVYYTKYSVSIPYIEDHPA